MTTIVYETSSYNPMIIDFSVLNKCDYGKIMKGVNETGCAILKNTNIDNVDDYENLLISFGIELSKEYRPGIAPRVIKSASGRSFSSTEAPKYMPIPPHNEMAYSNYRPTIISFWCKTAPHIHGETPLFDCNKIYQDLKNHKVFQEKRIFSRFFPDKKTSWDSGDVGGSSWKSSFNTEDKQIVEEFCDYIGMQYTWVDGGLQTTIEIDPVVLDHNKNKCLQLQTPLLKNIVYKYLLNKFPKRFDNEEYKKNLIDSSSAILPIKYSLDEELNDNEKRLFMDSIFRNSVFPKWEKGDVWIIDNIRSAHARMNVVGEREIIASLGNFEYMN